MKLGRGEMMAQYCHLHHRCGPDSIICQLRTPLLANLNHAHCDTSSMFIVVDTFPILGSLVPRPLPVLMMYAEKWERPGDEARYCINMMQSRQP